MNLQHITERTDRPVAHRRGGGRETVAVDLGPGTDAAVDLAGSTAIVVVGRGEDERVHEVDLPSADAEAFIRNGILTITVKEDAE